MASGADTQLSDLSRDLEHELESTVLGPNGKPVSVQTDRSPSQPSSPEQFETPPDTELPVDPNKDPSLVPTTLSPRSQDQLDQDRIFSTSGKKSPRPTHNTPTPTKSLSPHSSGSHTPTSDNGPPRQISPHTPHSQRSPVPQHLLTTHGLHTPPHHQRQPLGAFGGPGSFLQPDLGLDDSVVQIHSRHRPASDLHQLPFTGHALDTPPSVRTGTGDFHSPDIRKKSIYFSPPHTGLDSTFIEKLSPELLLYCGAAQRDTLFLLADEVPEVLDVLQAYEQASPHYEVLLRNLQDKIYDNAMFPGYAASSKIIPRCLNKAFFKPPRTTVPTSLPGIRPLLATGHPTTSNPPLGKPFPHLTYARPAYTTLSSTFQLRPSLQPGTISSTQPTQSPPTMSLTTQSSSINTSAQSASLSNPSAAGAPNPAASAPPVTQAQNQIYVSLTDMRPKSFDVTEVDNLDSFWSQFVQWIDLHAAVFGSASAQCKALRYVLKGQALEWFEDLLQKDDAHARHGRFTSMIVPQNLPALKKFFYEKFQRSKNAVRKAISQLKYQEGEPPITLITRFLSLAKKLDWNLEQQVEQFVRLLPAQMKQFVVGRPCDHFEHICASMTKYQDLLETGDDGGHTFTNVTFEECAICKGPHSFSECPTFKKVILDNIPTMQVSAPSPRQSRSPFRDRDGRRPFSQSPNRYPRGDRDSRQRSSSYDRRSSSYDRSRTRSESPGRRFSDRPPRPYNDRSGRQRFSRSTRPFFQNRRGNNRSFSRDFSQRGQPRQAWTPRSNFRGSRGYNRGSTFYPSSRSYMHDFHFDNGVSYLSPSMGHFVPHHASSYTTPSGDTYVKVEPHATSSPAQAPSNQIATNQPF